MAWNCNAWRVELWWRDPVDCVRELMGNPMFRDAMRFVPEGLYADEEEKNTGIRGEYHPRKRTRNLPETAPNVTEGDATSWQNSVKSAAVRRPV
ncbi:hypothetical protein B0H14DRAFT_2901682, partial [Mycena olivaceomarginata]